MAVTRRDAGRSTAFRSQKPAGFFFLQELAEGEVNISSSRWLYFDKVLCPMTAKYFASMAG